MFQKCAYIYIYMSTLRIQTASQMFIPNNFASLLSIAADGSWWPFILRKTRNNWFSHKINPRSSFGTEKSVQVKFWYVKNANEHKTKIARKSSTFFSRLMIVHLFADLLLWNWIVLVLKTLYETCWVCTSSFLTRKGLQTCPWKMNGLMLRW